ncbi:MAG: ATP-binding cassette domain-containing protein [Marinilabiliales bacterium]|nr:ATP-binding cassette domain-containing protein [Marinilabiliales bacterium]
MLKDISATFEPGKTNLIIGKSGSGKTVFLKCLVGLLDIDEGEIWYGDILFSTSSISRQRKRSEKRWGCSSREAHSLIP